MTIEPLLKINSEAGNTLGAQCLHAHAQHERAHMAAANLDALEQELSAQHPRAHEV